jgi:hypothetical protein
MDTVCSSEILVSTYESTGRHNPETQRHLHRREILRSLKFPSSSTRIKFLVYADAAPTVCPACIEQLRVQAAFWER